MDIKLAYDILSKKVDSTEEEWLIAFHVAIEAAYTLSEVKEYLSNNRDKVNSVSTSTILKMIGAIEEYDYSKN